MEYSRTRRRCSRISRGAPMMTIRTNKSSRKRENYNSLVYGGAVSGNDCYDLVNSMSDVSITVLEAALDKDRLIQPEP